MIGGDKGKPCGDIMKSEASNSNEFEPMAHPTIDSNRVKLLTAQMPELYLRTVSFQANRIGVPGRGRIGIQGRDARCER
jgi:hypothetical protein